MIGFNRECSRSAVRAPGASTGQERLSLRCSELSRRYPKLECVQMAAAMEQRL